MLACCALALLCAAPAARAQTDIADMHEDIRGLTQRLNELSLRVEQLEHENAGLRSKVGALDGNRDTVTTAQLNRAIADMNASIQTAVGASRAEILEKVATQMEKLAKQTNAALDSIARTSSPAPVREAAQPPAAAPAKAFGDAYSKDGLSYTVQKGDSLGGIARKTGGKAQEIIDANKLTDPSRIQAGQILFIPGGK
jgi:nucleoid-associated protein YgaU